MAIREAPPEAIKSFYVNVNLLINNIESLTLSKIGKAIPEVGSSNFLHYYNRRNTLTTAFLTKFYNAWEGKLDELSRGVFTMDDQGLKTATETDNKYGNGDEREKLLAAYQKITDAKKAMLKLLERRGIHPESPDKK